MGIAYTGSGVNGLGARHGQVALEAPVARRGHSHPALTRSWTRRPTGPASPAGSAFRSREARARGLDAGPHEGARGGRARPGVRALAAKFDPLVLAEEFVEGQELTASILARRRCRSSASRRPRATTTNQNKYFTDATLYHCPAGIRADLEDEIRRVALASFRVLAAAAGAGRDVMLRADGTFSFLEMNTSPGMTGHSLVPMAAKAVGISYPDLCLRILEGAAMETRP